MVNINSYVHVPSELQVVLNNPIIWGLKFFNHKKGSCNCCIFCKTECWFLLQYFLAAIFQEHSNVTQGVWHGLLQLFEVVSCILQINTCIVISYVHVHGKSLILIKKFNVFLLKICFVITFFNSLYLQNFTIISIILDIFPMDRANLMHILNIIYTDMNLPDFQ